METNLSEILQQCKAYTHFIQLLRIEESKPETTRESLEAWLAIGSVDWESIKNCFSRCSQLKNKGRWKRILLDRSLQRKFDMGRPRRVHVPEPARSIIAEVNQQNPTDEQLQWAAKTKHPNVHIPRTQTVTTVTPAETAAHFCTVCYMQGLPDKVGRVSAHSDVAAKRGLRDHLIAWLREECGVPPESLLVFVIDHALPALTPEGPTDPAAEGTYLSEDLVRGVPGLTPDRVLSANVDGRVVDDALQARGFVHALRLCACLALERLAPVVRVYGGLVAAHLDVWGAYATGAHRPLSVAVERRLFRPMAAPRGALVTFAASDLPARFAAGGRAVAEETQRVDARIRALFADHAGAYEERFAEWPSGLRTVYRTMQVHGRILSAAPQAR